MYKPILGIVFLCFFSLVSEAQLIKEKEYSVWLDRFISQIQADISFGLTKDEMDRFYSNLDRMPIPKSAADGSLFFSKMNQLIEQSYSFEISDDKAMVFRLLVRASPNRIMGSTENGAEEFLEFYKNLFENFKAFDYSDNEIIILIDATKLAPNPFEKQTEFQNLLDTYLIGYRYDGIRNHLAYEIKNQSLDFETGNLFGRSVNVKISGLERLRIQILTRENEKALQTIDEWILEERHGKR